VLVLLVLCVCGCGCLVAVRWGVFFCVGVLFSGCGGWSAAGVFVGGWGVGWWFVFCFVVGGACMWVWFGGEYMSDLVFGIGCLWVCGVCWVSWWLCSWFVFCRSLLYVGFCVFFVGGVLCFCFVCVCSMVVRCCFFLVGSLFMFLGGCWVIVWLGVLNIGVVN